MNKDNFEIFKDIAQAISNAHQEAPKGTSGDAVRSAVIDLANELKKAVIALAEDSPKINNRARTYKKSRTSIISCSFDLLPRAQIETEADASISSMLKSSFVKKEKGRFKIIGSTKHMPILIAWLYWKLDEKDAKEWHDKIQKISSRKLKFLDYKPDRECSDEEIDQLIADYILKKRHKKNAVSLHGDPYRAWKSLLKRFGQFTSVKLHVFKLIFLIAGLTRQEPTEKQTVALNQEFWFEITCPFDGFIIGFQEYKGLYYRLPLSEVDPIVSVQYGKEIVPINAIGKLLPLSEPHDTGLHGFIFLLVQSTELIEILLKLDEAEEIKPFELNSLASKLSNSQGKQWIIKRINVMFTAES